eukprot:SAG11_NODE_542_length_8640_cov_5.667603_6_plen_163_part_00
MCSTSIYVKSGRAVLDPRAFFGQSGAAGRRNRAAGDVQLAIRDNGDSEAVIFLDVFGSDDADRFEKARRLVAVVMQDYISGGPKALIKQPKKASAAAAEATDGEVDVAAAASEAQEEEKPPIYWYQLKEWKAGWYVCFCGCFYVSQHRNRQRRELCMLSCAC